METSPSSTLPLSSCRNRRWKVAKIAKGTSKSLASSRTPRVRAQIPTHGPLLTGCFTSVAALRSTRLQIITRHQTRAPILPHNLSLPPPIILQSQHSEDIAFAEGELFGYLGVIHVHCAGCGTSVKNSSLQNFENPKSQNENTWRRGKRKKRRERKGGRRHSQ